METETTVTFNPKGLVVTLVFLVVVGVSLVLARNIEVAVGAGAAASLVAHVLVDVFFSFSPAFGREQR